LWKFATKKIHLISTMDFDLHDYNVPCHWLIFSDLVQVYGFKLTSYPCNSVIILYSIIFQK